MSTFKPKKFIAAAESWFEKQRLGWIANVRATGLEPYAIMYAVREGWIMDTEDLDSVPADSIFPCTDIFAHARAVENMDEDEQEAAEIRAKLAISSAVKSGIAEAMAGIEAVKASEHSPQSILAPSSHGTVSGSETTPKTPLVATAGTARGTVQALTSQTIRLHRATIGGVDLYSIDRAHLEFMQAAQVQRVKIQVTIERGDHGLRVLDCRLADDEK